MRVIQMHVRLSVVIRAILTIECLLLGARGDGSDSEETTEIKYILIGGGIGLFLAAMFIITNICIMRKQVCEIRTDYSTKRPSEPNLVVLNHLNQPEHLMADGGSVQ
ncbi:uncharacterized protein PAE49_001435 [Odontesthes bonariensis]